MSETLQMNDEAARSTTGEILDQATPATEIAKAVDSSTTTETQSTSQDNTTTTEPAKTEAAKTAEAKPAAPDAYAPFKAPDNYTLDPKTIEAATPIFKELGLTQDQAQKLVDFHAGALIDAAKAPADAYTTMRADWQAKTLADPEIKAYALDGKTGIDAVKIDIGRALSALGDAALVADFKQAMDTTGAGDNPAFVKAVWKLAQKVGEGRPVSGKGPSPEGQRAPGTTDKPAPAKALYPNLS